MIIECYGGPKDGEKHEVSGEAEIAIQHIPSWVWPDPYSLIDHIYIIYMVGSNHARADYQGTLPRR